MNPIALATLKTRVPEEAERDERLAGAPLGERRTRRAARRLSDEQDDHRAGQPWVRRSAEAHVEDDRAQAAREQRHAEVVDRVVRTRAHGVWSTTCSTTSATIPIGRLT